MTHQVPEVSYVSIGDGRPVRQLRRCRRLAHHPGVADAGISADAIRRRRVQSLREDEEAAEDEQRRDGITVARLGLTDAWTRVRSAMMSVDDLRPLLEQLSDTEIRELMALAATIVASRQRPSKRRRGKVLYLFGAPRANTGVTPPEGRAPSEMR